MKDKRLLLLSILLCIAALPLTIFLVFHKQQLLGKAAVLKAKPNLLDLDVTHIERLPRINYDDPKKWPDYGETVEFKAHVKNHGSQQSGNFNYQFLIDDIVVFSGTNNSLLPEQEAVLTYPWSWPHQKTADKRIEDSHQIE